MSKRNILIFDPAETAGGAFSRAVEMAYYLPGYHYIFVTVKPFEKLHTGMRPPSMESIVILSFISGSQVNQLTQSLLKILPKAISPIAHAIPKLLLKINKISMNFQAKLKLRDKSVSLVQSNNGINLTAYYIAEQKKSSLIYYFRDLQYFSYLPSHIINRAMAYLFVGHNLMNHYLNSLDIDRSICHLAHSPFNANERFLFEDKDIDKRFLEKEKSQKQIIICVSRICEEKGQHVLIEAAHYISQKTSNFHIFFLGEASSLEKDVAYFNNIKRSVDDFQLNEFITFLGHKNNPLQYIKRADLSVQCPMYFEALAGVLVESIQLGTLTISADSGGANEVITDGKSGFLFKPGNSQDLAEKIMYCLENINSFEDLKKFGKDYTLEKWNPETIRKIINALYQGIDN